MSQGLRFMAGIGAVRSCDDRADAQVACDLIGPTLPFVTLGSKAVTISCQSSISQLGTNIAPELVRFCSGHSPSLASPG